MVKPTWVDDAAGQRPRHGRVRLDGQRMNIRLERTDDRDASFALERVAFERDLEAEIARAVADEEGSFALVAEDGDTIDRPRADEPRRGSAPRRSSRSARSECSPNARGRDAAAALVRAALEEAARRGERVVMLLGSPAFYPRFGFVPGSTFGLKNPYAGEAEDGFEIAEEGFMVARLDEAPLALDGRGPLAPCVR